MRRTLLGLVGVGLIGLGACSSSTETYKLDELLVQVHHDTGQIGLFGPNAKLLLLSQPDGLQLGSGSATWEYQFGAFQQLTATGTLAAASKLGTVTTAQGAISFALQHESDRPLGMARVERQSGQHAVVRLTAQPGLASTRSAHRIKLQIACRPNEHFLGFGGQSFDVDHRGQNIPIWVSEDGLGKQDNDQPSPGYFLVGKKHATHTPMPIFLSSAGYGVVVNTPAYANFDMCAADAERITIEVWDHELELHLFTGGTPLEILEAMTAYLGRPRALPRFAWAPWLDAIFGSDNVRRVAHKLRDRGVPSAVIWTEDWRGGYLVGDGTYALKEEWELDRTLYPDFEALAGELHELGFKFLTYHNTFLDTDSAIFDEARQLGHTIKDGSGAPFSMVGIRFVPTSLADLSSEAARTWVKDKIKLGFDQGADGHMADFAEWLPPDCVLASGEDAQLAHNRYPVEWARLNQEAVDEQRAKDGQERLYFMRAAHLGSQPLVQVMWAGDQQTDFQLGDGMPSVIPIGIGLGVTGFPYFGHDIAGYMSQLTTPIDRELWFRWVTFGALSPVMRTHHGRATEYNWSWETDEESTLHLARWAQLHMRLLPYLEALGKRAATTGAPMFAPLALQHPDFAPGWTAKDQFLLGDRIYVMPILERGATTRTVGLPEGTYYPLLGGTPLVVGKSPDQSKSATVSAALTEIPAYVRPGTSLVLLPADVQTTEASATVKYIDQVGEDRELWLWPGGASDFVEASGLRYAWQATSFVGDVASATFNGAPIAASPLSTNQTAIELVGPGELRLNDGQATLTLDGTATRRVRVLVNR